MLLDKKQKAMALAIMSGVLCFGQQAAAATSTLNVTAKAYIEKGTCTFKLGTGNVTSIPFAFNTVTPAEIEAKSKFIEQKLIISDCIGTSGIKVSLTSSNTVKIAGDATNNYIRPANAAVKVAYKMEIKTEGGVYNVMYAGGTANSLGGNFAPFGAGKTGNLYLKATLIPAVADIMTIGSGSLDSSATLNIDFL